MKKPPMFERRNKADNHWVRGRRFSRADRFLNENPTGYRFEPHPLFTIFDWYRESCLPCQIGIFTDDIIVWDHNSDLTKLENTLNDTLEKIQHFAGEPKLAFNMNQISKWPLHNKQALVQLSAKNFSKGQLLESTKNSYLSRVYSILNNCILQEYIITGLRHSCPNDIVCYEADLLPLSLRKRNKYGEVRCKARVSGVLSPYEIIKPFIELDK
ncbi:hypothetical protein CEXT_707631 [Caerostris extrusa]|uniref:Reverse transcriptase domain-containing protein n=1 Tax=Caerostris extrusa TaxID=172846 RepID=A0AAV4Y0P1_CAEEX|nr:hypothetical protein CEXT_707631 [Caerostris extrusa]